MTSSREDSREQASNRNAIFAKGRSQTCLFCLHKIELKNIIGKIAKTKTQNLGKKAIFSYRWIKSKINLDKE